jgi:predicted dehydrogenase
MLRVAVVGVGWAGTRHVQAIGELGRKVTVDCLVDDDAGFLAQKAVELGVHKTYTDYRDALGDPDVDAVSICSPHKLHCPMALAAAAAGKHVLCEKPMALTVDDASHMIEASEEHGVKLYVAENLPYDAMSRFLREIVQTGQYVGELTFVSLVRGFWGQNYGYPGRRAWLALPELGGTGTWTLHGIHTVAQLRYILGEVETVYVREHRASSYVRSDVEGTMSGLLTMESGIHVFVAQTSETRLPGNLGGYVLYGDRGSLRAYRDGCEIFDNTAGNKEPLLLAYPEMALSSYAQEMEAFADYVTGVSEGPTTGYSERRSVAIVQAGYESARTGKPIHLRSHFGTL